MDEDEHIHGVRQSREKTPNGKRLAAYKNDTLARKAARRRWYAHKRRRQRRKIEEQDIGSQSDSSQDAPPIVFGSQGQASPPVAREVREVREVGETLPALIIGTDEWDPVDYPSPLPQLGFWGRLLWFR